MTSQFLNKYKKEILSGCKRSISLIAAIFIAATAAPNASAAELTFEGSRVIAVNGTITGLDMIYVVENLDGVTATYPSASAQWSGWSTSGAAYNSPLAASTGSGTSSYTFANGADTGITIEDAGRQHHFWIVNYANHIVDFDGLSVSHEDNDCMSMYLNVDGISSPTGSYDIIFYTINGALRRLDRRYKLSYNTLEYDKEAEQYRQIAVTNNISSLSPRIRVDKPLCDTYFTLSDDMFALEWGIGDAAESEFYATDAVEAETIAVQSERDNDNEEHDNTTALGGSAPIDITFKAIVSDAARFTEWQLSKSPEFDSYELRFNQTEVEYTFRDYGTWYMRFQASNNDGTCDYFSPTYEINVGESKLICPNAFSPGASEGVNDEWKVSYKSIVEFECHIFNRWGTKIIELKDPSQGWDGRYNGKLVPSGVYYYVIKARGADGHKYNMSGDINIIRYNDKGSTTPTE